MAQVYAYGVIAPSTLVVLDHHPSPGGYAEIGGVHHSIGGEAAGGAFVLARLGVDTSLDGNWLSNDESSARTIDLLTGAGVDCSLIRRVGDTPAVTEIVLSAGDARTVLGTYGQLLDDRAWNDPSKQHIRESRIVCLDPFFPDASLQAARWCREAGTPYVTVDIAPETEIARHAEILVVSEEYATRALEITDPHEVLAAYAGHCSGLVIYTRGNREVLYGRTHGPVGTFSPFAVEALDTTGAGDSFRAGVIYGMLRGSSDDQLVRTAAAVAALVCRRFPGVLHSPTEDELARFLAEPA